MDLKEPLISFLVCAHNEEKIIGIALEKLEILQRSFGRMEVLVGLDGCTDGTLDVVKRYPFARVISNPERMGKQYVVERLKKEARAGIIAVNDADWHIESTAEELQSLINCFDDPRVGGLGDYFTTSYDEDKLKSARNLLYLGDAWIIHFVLEYKLNHCVFTHEGKTFADKNNLKMMFYVYFFRKDAVGEQTAFADDTERTIQLFQKDYGIRMLPLESRPCFKASYSHIGLRSFIRQRVRGFLVARQITVLYPQFKGGSEISYVAILWYTVCNVLRVKRLRAVLGIALWWAMAVVAFILYRLNLFKRMPQSKIWTLRADRW